MTPRMQQALDAIRRLTVKGVAPTYDELAADMGLTTKSAAFRIVKLLRERGLVTSEGGTQRNIKIVEGPTRAAMEAWSDAEILRVQFDLQQIQVERGDALAQEQVAA
jgi:SOS-response transcriptional repressor LexA